MQGIKDTPNGHVVISGRDHTLTYSPRLVTLDDGTSVSHESQGGDMSAVWAVDLGGGFFVEVAHLGDGPLGGELVMTVTWIGMDETRRYVAIGDLFADELPAVIPASWPVAVDLALGLLDGEVELLGADITKADVEALHQRLLGALHG